jgi:hypothetical protein
MRGQMRCVAAVAAAGTLHGMSTNNITIRMPDADRAILAALANRVAEDLGVELTSSDLIRLAVKRLPTSPAELFRPPEAVRS